MNFNILATILNFFKHFIKICLNLFKTYEPSNQIFTISDSLMVSSNEIGQFSVSVSPPLSQESNVSSTFSDYYEEPDLTVLKKVIILNMISCDFKDFPIN